MLLSVPNFGMFTVYMGRLLLFFVFLYILDYFVYLFRKDNK